MVKDASKVGGMRAMMSTLMQRTGLARMLGSSHNGKRNYYEAFGYKVNLTYGDYLGKYKRQDVAKRIVNAPASATWRNPPKIGAKAEKFATDWDELVVRLKLWGEIERVDRLAGLGEYAVLLLGISDGRAMDQPINPSYANNELMYVQPYAQPNAKIVEYESDMQNERYGLPKMYELLTTSADSTMGIEPIKAKDAIPVKVHWTRIVHVAEDVLDSNFLGTPRLEAVYNLLDDLLKTVGGSAETFWMVGNRGMQIDVDPEMQLTEADAADLSDELDEFQHGLRRMIRTRGVKVNNLGSDTPDPKNNFDVIMSLISGATGIPKRVLTGSEAGQLASDQDRANWADRIKERRTTFAEPNVLIPLLARLIYAEVLPKTDLTKVVWTWPPNFQLTPLEEAQTMAQKARALVNIAKHYSDTPLLNVEEARGIIGFEGPLTGTIPEPAEIPEDPNANKDDGQDTSKTTNDPSNDPGAPDNSGPTDA